MNEPIIKVPNPSGNGAPIISEEQYRIWLDDMRPYLRQGSSLNYAIEKADLTKYLNRIYEKYRVGDWFSQRVDTLRSTVGELINNIGFKVIENLHNRMVETDGKTVIADHEAKMWKTMAEKHRTAQSFFVNRTETADADDSKLGKIIESLDKSDYDELAGEAQKQILANDASVQNQGQERSDSSVQAEPNPVETSG